MLPSALVAAKNNMTANAYYRELRDSGLAARRSEVLQLYKIAKGITTRAPDEPFRNIHVAPTADEIAAWPTRKAEGIIQRVALTYRDRTTGHVSQTWWSTVSPDGITRERALAMAIDAYSEHAESYDQELIGAVHTSVYRQVPGLAGE